MANTKNDDTIDHHIASPSGLRGEQRRSMERDAGFEQIRLRYPARRTSRQLHLKAARR